MLYRGHPSPDAPLSHSFEGLPHIGNLTHEMSCSGLKPNGSVLCGSRRERRAQLRRGNRSPVVSSRTGLAAGTAFEAARLHANFDPGANSPKGAIGLMQLMPATAPLFGADATVPEQNVDAGTHDLRISSTGIASIATV